MVVLFEESENAASAHDPLYPWLLSIKKAVEEWHSGNSSTESVVHLDDLLSHCITTFMRSAQYRNDIRFLKICFLYLDGTKDFQRVYAEMEENEICVYHSLLYEWYALFLEVKEKWLDAHKVYQIGILRKAEPLERLRGAQSLFLKRMFERLNGSSLQKIGGDELTKSQKCYVNPWSPSTMKGLLQKINCQMTKYDGYYPSNKAYPGKVALSTLQKARNKVIELGGKKYQIKGCAGKGGFAQVFKAHVNGNPDDIIALKIQTPAFPWEFYMYRQLDQRISDKGRSCFGFGHRMHLYSDCSVLVCDYLSHGTLQDAINSYVVIGKCMEEVLCIYYTIEMLYMLESLHRVGIIHGDFKPDNLLIRYARDNLTEDGFHDRSGPWRDQGLCLVDWGRGIDLRLFPDGTKFEGDCRTSGFRCVEMQEKKPWTFQVDTYGLCVIVHMMLHNSYMGIEKQASSDGGYVYLPKTPFKRYYNIELWRNLFTKLLNTNPANDENLLQVLRESFQDYMRSNPQFVKKLKDLLAKQRASLCSA
ncbi:Pkinase domain-containing protein/Mad3_BUB1_I domain-containing protein [Cephalotus follicularis]|uniref:Pkinase domain-containing protein/Mad3_BUB1_I domain-containing protein n=1 Tax=Cephalotus follicularis TaxID=3775 RepID=A0A1Q3CJZ5_CEPFO|nr:Pkinase domain-containing protein/Mad3_BUB1_I domain-containing protein [Cephalotus follicularis]